MASRYSEHFHTLTRIWRHPNARRSEIDRFRNQKLQSVIQNAYRHVPYYRSLFDAAGLLPHDIRTAEDLKKIPVSVSQDYRFRPLEQIVSSRCRPSKMVFRPTSGSTGRPFVILRTSLEDHLINFFRIRAYDHYGFEANHRRAAVGFVSPSHRKDNLLGSIRQFLRIYSTYKVDCLGGAEDILAELFKIQPDFIVGFPGALAFAASHMKSNRYKIRPKMISTGGETLTASRREAIESGFGCRVYNTYGSHEFNLLAWECRQTGKFHVCDDNVILEVLHDGQPAAPGEDGVVVATGLHCYGMPFIRYALGDVVTQGYDTCSCGQPFSTILNIRGRIHDYFKLPDGSLMHPDRIVVPIMENEGKWFDQYQLLQVRKGLITLKIVPVFPPSPEQLSRVERIAKGQLPTDVAFDIDLVDRIAAEPSGKVRYCKSMLNPQPDEK